MIKVIIGLGNPGTQYYHTRHNIGYRVVDALADQYGASWKTRSDSEECDVRVGEKTIRLIKPLTFMNNSAKLSPNCCVKGLSRKICWSFMTNLNCRWGKLNSKLAEALTVTTDSSRLSVHAGIIFNASGAVWAGPIRAKMSPLMFCARLTIRQKPSS